MDIAATGTTITQQRVYRLLKAPKNTPQSVRKWSIACSTLAPPVRRPPFVPSHVNTSYFYVQRSWLTRLLILPPLAYCQPTIDLGKSSDVFATQRAQSRHPDDIQVQKHRAKAVQALKEVEKPDFIKSRLSQLLRQNAPSKTCHPDLQQQFQRTFMSSLNGSQALRGPPAPPNS